MTIVPNFLMLMSAIALLAVSSVLGAEKRPPDGGKWNPQQLSSAWPVMQGRGTQSLVDGNWVVRAPQQFIRGLDFGRRPKAIRQHGEVEVTWGTNCRNNYSADGLRIITQGRAFRIHPIHRPDGPDLLLTGTPKGMRPDIPQAIVDLEKLPDFDARAVNVYRVRWETNTDNTYQFQLFINGTEIGQFHGEPSRPREPHTVNFEFRSGEHRIGFLRWKLFQAGEVVPDKPIKLSQHPQLLFDHHLVEEYRDLKRTIHQPRMHADNPVFTWQKPWEYGAVLLWGTVIFDEQEDLFKMWYMCWGNDAGGALPGYRTPVCYATSSDGVRWHRPQFDHCPFKMKDLKNPDGPAREFSKNNIVFNLPKSSLGMDSPTVVKDLREADSKRRYKMSYWHRLPTGTGIYHAYSPDGIHWTHIPKMVADTGDRNTFHWDAFREKWVTVSRPSASFYEFDEFGESNGNFVRTHVPFDPRDRRPPAQSTDIYSFPVFNYGGMQIGVPEFYGRGTTNRWVSYLAWSHDGIDWTIDPERVPWMPWSDRAGDFDCWRRNIHNGGVIRRGDKLWIYFSGRSQGKNIPGKSGFLVPSGEPGFDPRGIVGSIGIGTLRVDGFCSRDAGSSGGSLRTKSFQFTGSQLVLNVDVKRGGMVKAALLDEHGKPLDGFDVKQCEPISGDHIAKVVTWNGQSDLSLLSGRLVRLQLELVNANLYSFRFAQNSPSD